MGFWSADYVARKLTLLRQAGLTNLILCIDETRVCGDEELPANARGRCPGPSCTSSWPS